MRYLVESVSATKHFVERICHYIIHKLFGGVSRTNAICVCSVGHRDINIMTKMSVIFHHDDSAVVGLELKNRDGCVSFSRRSMEA